MNEINTVITISDETSENSQVYIGKWNQLISTTNWEKGEIICQWRATLESQNADSNESSDEAWSQMVGGVSAQHVGRLRRTWERFGHVFNEYQGIYWSHFYAALDWDDAEMWLEGAIQNKWSVSRMRKNRWEVLGKIPDQEPQDGDIITGEMSEESQSLDLSERKRFNDRDLIEGPVHEGPDFGDDDAPGKDGQGRVDVDLANEVSVTENGAEGNKKPKVRPFESFGDLPDDIQEAANLFKIAIIRHRTDEWDEISKDDLTGLLDALKQLVDA